MDEEFLTRFTNFVQKPGWTKYFYKNFLILVCSNPIKSEVRELQPKYKVKKEYFGKGNAGSDCFGNKRCYTFDNVEEALQYCKNYVDILISRKTNTRV